MTGPPQPVTVSSVPLGLGGIDVTYGGSHDPPLHAGSYAVSATLANPDYAAPDAGGQPRDRPGFGEPDARRAGRDLRRHAARGDRQLGAAGPERDRRDVRRQRRSAAARGQLRGDGHPRERRPTTRRTPRAAWRSRRPASRSSSRRSPTVSSAIRPSRSLPARRRGSTSCCRRAAPCGLAAAVVTLNGLGTCTITASQAGNGGLPARGRRRPPVRDPAAARARRAGRLADAARRLPRRETPSSCSGRSER